MTTALSRPVVAVALVVVVVVLLTATSLYAPAPVQPSPPAAAGTASTPVHGESEDAAAPAVLPRLVADALVALADEGRARLKAAVQQGGDGGDANPFADVAVTLPLPTQLVRASDGIGGEVKAVVAPNALRARGDKCLVYSLGVAGEVAFEQYMDSLGCTVHAFDCTVVAPKPTWKFAFHDWCIGRERSFEDNIYSKEKAKAGLKFGFLSLRDTMAKLGHTRLDVLKFDIEGFEWELFENEIFPSPNESLPEQLLFELHTEGANTVFVPPAVVATRTKSSVDQLFLGLHDRGYRVVNKELNRGDRHCAEFTLVRVGDAA